MIAQPNLEPRGWNGGPMKYGASLGRPSMGLTEHFTADVARKEAAHQRDLAAILLDCLNKPRKPYDDRSDGDIRRAMQDRLAEAYKLECMAESNVLDVFKTSLRKIRIDNGGYDSGGAYWGIGQPLYWAGSDCGTIDLWFRAPTRDDAKDHVRSKFPNARFYR